MKSKVIKLIRSLDNLYLPIDVKSQKILDDLYRRDRGQAAPYSLKKIQVLGLLDIANDHHYQIQIYG